MKIFDGMKMHGAMIKKIIQFYLNDRYQRILLKNTVKHFSKWEPVKHGVPWGSILGPLFFLLYINELPKIISDVSKPILFTGDTSIIITNSDPTDFKRILTMFLSKQTIGLKVIYCH